MEGIFASGGQSAPMSDPAIGVPQIDPRHRTSWQDSRHPRGRPDEKDKDGFGNGSRDRPPPESGTGEVVDKVV
jgi:hypothetical protein